MKMKNVSKALVLILLLSVPMAAQTVQKDTTVGADATDTATAVTLQCGMAYVQFYLNGNAIGPQIQPTIGTDHYSFVWDTKTVANGSYTMTAKAVDKAGLNGTCDGTKPNSTMSAPVTFTVANTADDVTPPTVTMTPLLSGAVVTAKQQPIQVAAMDESAIKQITLKVNGVIKASVSNQNTLSMVWNTNPYKGLNVVLEAAATDVNGNTRTKSTTVSVKK